MKPFEFNTEQGLESVKNLHLYWQIHSSVSPEDSVLEIGCGDGAGWQADGPPQIAEKAGEYLAIDKERYDNPPFNFVQADILEYGLSCYYDKIISLYVIQYVDPDKLFELVSSALAPGGVAYFSEGMVWQRGGERETPAQICSKCRSSLERAFNTVEIYGVDRGILVAEKAAKTGVFAIASN